MPRKSTVEVIEKTEFTYRLVKAIGKPALYLSVSSPREPYDRSKTEAWVRSVEKSLCGRLHKHAMDLCFNEELLLVADTDAEVAALFRLVTDSGAVYACTFNAHGEVLDENT